MHSAIRDHLSEAELRRDERCGDERCGDELSGEGRCGKLLRSETLRHRLALASGVTSARQ
jgi:hypothetical protein